jgi:hypothetical protein
MSIHSLRIKISKSVREKSPPRNTVEMGLFVSFYRNFENKNSRNCTTPDHSPDVGPRNCRHHSAGRPRSTVGLQHRANGKVSEGTECSAEGNKVQQWSTAQHRANGQ